MIDKWIQLIQNKLERWGDETVKMLPNFLLAVLVMICFIILAKLVRKISAKIIHRLSKSESISGLTSSVLYTLVMVVGIMTSLKILQLEQAVTSLLAGVGIIGLALGFAFQDLTSNFISGAFIAFKRPFDVGHYVETNGFVGRIEDIQLRATTMRTFAGLHVIIPNKDIFQKPIINYSLTSGRRVEIEFFVSNKADLDEVENKLRNAVQQNSTKNNNLEPEVYFSQIEDARTKVYVSFWTAHIEPDDYMKARHEAIIEITRAIKTIDIPA